MLQHGRSFDEERSGEAPMEIDSPPPLWLLNSRQDTSNSTGATSPASSPLSSGAAARKERNASAASVIYEVHDEPAELTATTTTTSTGTSSPLAASTTAQKTPVSARLSPSMGRSKTGSPAGAGRSPLRSVHMGGADNGMVQLRRLHAHPSPTSQHHIHSSPHSTPFLSTFSSSPFLFVARRTPPQAAVSPYPIRSVSSAGGKRARKDPTKAAAAAALATTSATSWHLHFPIILMNYFQLVFNTALGAGLLYLLILGTRTVLYDAQLKVDERLQVMMAEIALCSRQYVDNRCTPETRVPAMERACIEWETCMSRDPSSTSRSRLFAETIAEILNGFFGAISTKTYVCLISGGVLVVVLFNAAFYFGRQWQPGVSGGFYRPTPPGSHIVDSLLSSHYGTPLSSSTANAIHAAASPSPHSSVQRRVFHLNSEGK